MKKIFLLILVGLFAQLAPAQTIRRVNNTPGLNDPNVYATAQAAHDASVDGDIIYLEPAGGPIGVIYNSLTVNRRVTIYGPGYLLDKGNPNVSFDKRSVRLDYLYLSYGSANSTIKGLNITNFSIGANNITVDRCYITGIGLISSRDPTTDMYSHGNNVTITRCLISGGLVASNDGLSGIGIVANNNIFGSVGGPLQYLSNSVITRNTFLRGTNATYVNGCTFTNNIIDARDSSPNYEVFNHFNSAGNSISNNICLGANGLPSGNGNVNGADPTTTFVVEDTYLPFFSDGDAVFKLSPNSPAKNVAAGGGEAGAFGSGAPYLLSGLPPIPIVTNFTNSGSGNASTPLSVTISVRSNN